MDRQLIQEIKAIITKAGKIAVETRELGLEVTLKEDNSPVTNADKAISDYIFTKLSSIAPEIPVICEERPIANITDRNLFWLVDPVDGTRSFIKNSDNFTVNIALIENRDSKYGFVYLPAKDKLYYTDENQNLVIEEQGAVVKSNLHNQEGYVAVVSSHHFNPKTELYLKDHKFSEVIAVPSSIKLCMVAEGAGDVYPKFGPTMEWDIAAGHALIKATGGDIHTISGEKMKYAKENFLNSCFIAANKRWL